MQRNPIRPIVLLVASLLVVTACAPEGSEPQGTLRPGQIAPLPSQDKPATSTDGTGSSAGKEQGDVATDSPAELGEIEGRQPVEIEKNQTLPVSFPSQEIPIPSSAQIDDAGERSTSNWFVVLRYDSIAEAQKALETLAEDGSFAIALDETDSNSEFAATLTRDAIIIEAYAFDDAGTALLNLEVDVQP